MAPQNYLFIIGTAKAGTSALANWLGARDDMVLGKIKEPRTHSDLDQTPWDGPASAEFRQTILADTHSYDQNFAHKPEAEWVIDASTDYLWCPASPGRLADFAKTRRCKFVCLTRDPVARTISQYRHTLRLGTAETLRQALDREAARIKMHWQPLYWHIRRSHIERDIQTYADLFGNDLLILDYDDLQDPNKVLARVARFLEVPVQPLLGQSEYNTTLLPRNRLVAALYRNAGLRDTLRNLVPVPLRSRLRALGHTTRPVQVSEKEKHLVLTLLKDEIAACITNPLIPTQNWRSAQALDTCTATHTHSLLKKWRKNALGS
ncbi:MAG: sulfotransferase [Rhodobacteraceae bacterium]|nr:sulfotransferase [Paracoccaceae bacterium]